MKNQGNMTPPNEHSNFPVTKPKEMKICNLPNKEFTQLFKGSSVSYKKIQTDNSMNSRQQYTSKMRHLTEIQK